MSAEAVEDANTRRGLYNPYPWRKTACVALVAGAAALVMAHERFVVQGTSMAPALAPGDRLLVRRRPRRLAIRARGVGARGVGALVVVADPRDPRRLVVKRVAAIGEDGVTVLGDNPEASTDSRTYGPVPRAALRGRVVYRYAPAGRAGRPV